MDLAEKVAFVTGGSGDIGGAIAKALAASGANVAVSYVGEADPSSAVNGMPMFQAALLVDAVQKFGRQSLAVHLDQRDALTADIWDRVLETNLRGPFLLSRAFAPGLMRP